MPTVVLTIGQDGKPAGVSKADQDMYMRWRKRLTSLKPGDAISFSWEDPRDPAFHGMHFKMLNVIFENQETFTTERELREWAERGARHVEVLTFEGASFERVRSVDYATLDDAEFRKLHNDMKAFLLSEPALKTLWPHCKIGTAFESMQVIMEGKWE